MKQIDKWDPGITMVGLLCLLALAGLVNNSVQTPVAAQSSSATCD